MWFSCFPVLPGSAEAQVTWGGIGKRLSIAYFIGNISAQKYQNAFTYVKVIANQRWDVFWDAVYIFTLFSFLHLCYLYLFVYTKVFVSSCCDMLVTIFGSFVFFVSQSNQSIILFRIKCKLLLFKHCVFPFDRSTCHKKPFINYVTPEGGIEGGVCVHTQSLNPALLPRSLLVYRSVPYDTYCPSVTVSAAAAHM